MLQPSSHQDTLPHLHNSPSSASDELVQKSICLSRRKISSRYSLSLCVQYKFSPTGRNWICCLLYIFCHGTNVSNISEKVFFGNFFRAICLFLHFIPGEVAKSKFHFNIQIYSFLQSLFFSLINCFNLSSNIFPFLASVTIILAWSQMPMW